MLQNPKWDVGSTHSLIAWLETKDPRKHYEFFSDHCLYGQYLADHGETWIAIKECNYNHYWRIALTEPHTFGAALKRARAVVA